MKINYLWRIRLLALGLVLVTAVFMIKLFHLQVIRASSLSEQADQQYLKPVEKIFDRGTIFFTSREGTLFSAATSKTGFKVSINPEMISDPEPVYNQLKDFLHLDQETFWAKATKVGDKDETIASRLPEDLANQIKALNLRGVYVIKERWRFYPGEDLAAHTLGFMAYQGDDYAGRYGLEKSYDNLLRRSEEPSFREFFAQLFAGIGEGIWGRLAAAEGDLILTIEPTVQNFIEDELTKVAVKYQVPAAGAIVMDPKTGALYTLAAYPSFNPGERQSDLSRLANPLVERVFEMGSIVKPLTMAAALDAGVISADSTYDDAGTIKVGTAIIKNFDGRARGRVDMQQVLNESLNTGAVHAMQQLGQDRFRRYFLAFGIGEKTGIELPGEVAGLTSNFESNRDVEYATASFGQGFAVTPLAITRALAVLGNSGYLPSPHVVKSIRYLNGETDEINRPLGRRVISNEASEEITRMLVRVVDEALRGGTVKLPHYRIAAKTGTAQIARPGGGGYYEDQYLHSFFGYFPAYDPKFIIFLYLVNPQGARYASETLTEPFIQITKFLISYYGLPPDR